MIAEIRGKISGSGSNLSERLENQLTGDFFGSLRYLPFDIGLRRILCDAVFPHKMLDDVGAAEAWNDKISFWPQYDRTEPDVIIELADEVILIEVKYHSGLSSDDDIGAVEADTNSELEVSRNQLAREARILAKHFPNKEKYLLLLAPQETAAEIYHTVCERGIIPSDVRFGYITWQKSLKVLKRIEPSDVLQKIVVSDLVDLLIRKGFEQFSGFADCASPSVTDGVWMFDYTVSALFNFQNMLEISEGLYYEFK